MVKKKIFVLIFGIILIFSSCSVEREGTIKIAAKKKRSGNHQLYYPEVRGGEPAVTDKINRDIFETANSSLDQWEYKDNKEEMKFKSIYSIKFNEEEILSIRFDQKIVPKNSVRTYHEISSITVNKDSGYVYKIGDFFIDKSNYEKVISQFIKEKIVSQNIDTIREFQGIDMKQEFYIKKNSIVVYYQPYVYTTRSYGPLVIEIPFTYLFRIVKKEYLDLFVEGSIDRGLLEQCGMFRLN